MVSSNALTTFIDLESSHKAKLHVCTSACFTSLFQVFCEMVVSLVNNIITNYFFTFSGIQRADFSLSTCNDYLQYLSGLLPAVHTVKRNRIYDIRYTVHPYGT